MIQTNVSTTHSTTELGVKLQDQASTLGNLAINLREFAGAKDKTMAEADQQTQVIETKPFKHNNRRAS